MIEFFQIGYRIIFLNDLQLLSSEQTYEEIKILKIFNQGKHEFRYCWTAPIDTYLNDMDLTLHRTNNWISEYFSVSQVMQAISTIVNSRINRVLEGIYTYLICPNKRFLQCKQFCCLNKNTFENMISKSVCVLFTQRASFEHLTV